MEASRHADCGEQGHGHNDSRMSEGGVGMTLTSHDHICHDCGYRAFLTHTTVSTVYLKCAACGNEWHVECPTLQHTSAAFRITAARSRICVHHPLESYVAR